MSEQSERPGGFAQYGLIKFVDGPTNLPSVAFTCGTIYVPVVHMVNRAAGLERVSTHTEAPVDRVLAIAV